MLIYKCAHCFFPAAKIVMRGSHTLRSTGVKTPVTRTVETTHPQPHLGEIGMCPYFPYPS